MGRGNLPEDGHPLGVVDHADEPAGCGGQDLFPGQCPAAALDKVEVLVGLVGPVHVQVQVPGLRQVRDLEAGRLQPLLGIPGTGHHGGDAWPRGASSSMK